MNSTMPRLAMLNSPSKLNARGSESEPYIGDLAVVDVAGELGGILVLFVFRLEGADADAVLFGEHQAPDPDVLDHLRPVAFVPQHQLADRPGGRPGKGRPSTVMRLSSEHLLIDCSSSSARNSRGIQLQRLLVHRADTSSHPRVRPRSVGTAIPPGIPPPRERVECAFGGPRVSSSPFFSSRAIVDFEEPTGPCKQQHAPLRCRSPGRGLDHVDELHRAGCRAPKIASLPPSDRVVEEVVVR